MIRFPEAICDSPPSIPRESGDDPNSIYPWAMRTQYSPRERG